MPTALPHARSTAPAAALPAGRGVSFVVRIAVLAASLVGLLAHAISYRFLTDDAFISFRYARNLAHGHGLVFNPGFERVEGYTNFLWVVLLAGLERLGIRPEAAAHGLSLVATVALWALVAAFARRLASDGRAAWVALVAPVALALTRSVAVWSTSGLETRLFEVLIVAGAIRWTIELEFRINTSRGVLRDASIVPEDNRTGSRTPNSLQSESQSVRRWSLTPWFFGLAALTRPDGLLPAVSAFLVGAWWLARARRLDAGYVRAWWPFLLLVGGHLAFRRIYYGEWLPNTWYAKVGGEFWWSAGAGYLGAFVLEYALWLWLPLALIGAASLARRGRGLFPALAGAIVVPHALYVVAIGGDHFEYRPLELAFPFVFLLAGEGVRAMFVVPARRVLATVWLTLALGGLWMLPWESRRQFPDIDTVGFPGRMLEGSGEGRGFLDAPRGPYRIPGLAMLAGVHRDLLRDLTRQFVGIRHEELARFGRSVIPEGRRMRALIDDGRLPRDLHLAMGAVGAIPYYTDLRVLDVLGLTDKAVARSGAYAESGERLMAHDRRLRWEDAVARGVDLISADAHPLLRLDSDALLSQFREAMTWQPDVYAADVGEGWYLVGMLPQGHAQAAGRMPRLALRRLDEPAFVDEYMTRAIAAWRDSLSSRPTDLRARLRLAWLLLAHMDYREARTHYRAVIAARPDDLEAWDQLAWCELRLGDVPAARDALARAITIADARGSRADADRLRDRLRGM